LKLREKLLISLLVVSLIPFLGMAIYQHQSQRKQLFDRGGDKGSPGGEGGQVPIIIFI